MHGYDDDDDDDDGGSKHPPGKKKKAQEANSRLIIHESSSSSSHEIIIGKAFDDDEPRIYWNLFGKIWIQRIEFDASFLMLSKFPQPKIRATQMQQHSKVFLALECVSHKLQWVRN